MIPPFNPNSFSRQYVENTKQNAQRHDAPPVMCENENSDDDAFSDHTDEHTQNDTFSLETALHSTIQRRAKLQQFADFLKIHQNEMSNPGGGESAV